MKAEREIIEQKANILKALSSPARLCIVKTLIEEGEKTVGDITNCMGLSQSSISQQLAKLKITGLVDVRREGNMAFYSCNREDVKSFVETLFEMDKNR
ncbi:ArsR/SmtB family transcription factor [Mogibacterium pumilum]|uniref:HTH arsR-type domain-containing protein n=1 Tax=Mogibacterium pumilum TaxID=86332 RepID=A0A223ARX0_9FIRM|nr:metalloregulator ArsR/SmtB family transcription factor [Mogibacterium pumilum]ASS37669.1 hypothetical protein AXF17_03850 [Mogibacterium pumilum]